MFLEDLWDDYYWSKFKVIEQIKTRYQWKYKYF
jgi:hypothetical protein